MSAFLAWSVHYRAKRALVGYGEQLVAAGEKLTVNELTPKPIPPDQNGAALFVRATSLLNVNETLLSSNPPPTMRAVAPGKAMVGWAQPDIRDASATNTWADADSTMADLSQGMELLEQLIEQPILDHGLDYRQGFALKLPNLHAATLRTAQQLTAGVICDLHRQDVPSAMRRLRTMLALVKGSADERLAISQLVRIAIAAIALSANWELLQSPGVTEEQLAVLQNDWLQIEFIPSVENSLAMERAMIEMTFAKMRNSSAEFRAVASAYSWGGPVSTSSSDDWLAQVETFGKEAWANTRLKTKETAWRLGWSYADQLRALKGYQVLIETARSVQSNGCFRSALLQQKARLADLGIGRSGRDNDFGTLPADLEFRSLMSESVASLDKILTRVMSMEASRQMLISAIALRRYKLRHQSYPSELVELMPEFLRTVPRDPVDGQTLRYRLMTEETFLLYSVGEDGQDNGGDAKPLKAGSKSRYWMHGKDWVWPQPATAEEIETYYRENAKQPSR